MGSISGLEKRFQRSIANGEYYVAEQTCRTLYHRLTHPKDASKLDLPNAFEQILIATFALLERGRPQEGTALALLAVKHLVDYKVAIERDVLDKMKMVSAKYEKDDGKRVVRNDGSQKDEELKMMLKEKVRFLKAVVNWTKNDEIRGTVENGYEWFNGRLGECLGRLGEFKESMHVLIFSDEPEIMAEMLDRWVKEKGLKSERDLFLCRAVLLYLVSENLRDAHKMYRKFVALSGWRSSSEKPPLANFCELLLQVVLYDKRAAKLYQKLLSTYKRSLDRDEKLSKLTTEVGQHYFSIQPPKPGGIFGMMGQMLGGMMQ
eukprot:Plantae.Rhodophyta-Hildenbrandia_rubra.ctg1968.p1 GENE.Plantae.Rhodophyta-Hildenbrandia_rubra.ctg1968~~Plantae.Rhodophyta-Hildenbrandia_rubra.ctg1968.p1  ORF type:complete len:328 (-),score=72.04 Plantae.Rhodophyta-Hildenbrandia_rubra.ctg1968:706-1659(-)